MLGGVHEREVATILGYLDGHSTLPLFLIFPSLLSIFN